VTKVVYGCLSAEISSGGALPNEISSKTALRTRFRKVVPDAISQFSRESLPAHSLHGSLKEII
jgi:hypothetical protein